MTRPSFSNEVGRILDGMFRTPAYGFADPPGRGILVAVSGGPDSVALLLAVHDWCLGRSRPLAAAHLNHCLRADDSDADARFCAELCAARSIPLHLHAEDPRPVARTRGQGLEEAGRHLRHRFFRSLLDAHPELACVAAGHHRDDQIETVVMRLFRGTGPDGLRGLRPVQGRTIHPLLGFRRGEILAYLEQQNQPWRLDATNETGDNARARVRRELLPLARDLFGPGCGESCARLAGLMNDELELLDKTTDRAFVDVTLPATGTTEASATADLHVPGLLDLEPVLARRVLRRWLDTVRTGGAVDIEKAHLENILAWLRASSSGTRLDLPGPEYLRRDFDRLGLHDDAKIGVPLRSAADYRILVADAGPIEAPDVHGRSEAAGDPATGGPWNLTCPASVLQGSVRIRNWRDGDRFQPFGLDGSRKLSDLLREKKVPAARRTGTLVIEDDAGILWVLGLARSERTRLLPSTGPTVTISVIERSGESHDKRKN